MNSKARFLAHSQAGPSVAGKPYKTPRSGHTPTSGKSVPIHDYKRFLKDLGYLVPEVGQFTIQTSNVARSPSSPDSNARYALNAATGEASMTISTEPIPFQTIVCAENSNSDIMVMQSAEDRVGTDAPSSLNRARERRVLIQRAMRSRYIIVGGIGA
jgi:hypothetical protein